MRIPTDAELDTHRVSNPNMNDKFLNWVNGKFGVDRLSDKLMNDKPNKYAAYYWFERSPLLQN